MLNKEGIYNDFYFISDLKETSQARKKKRCICYKGRVNNIVHFFFD